MIAVPDDKSGEAVKALVVLKPDARDTITPEDVMSWCREQIAVYKAPRRIQFVDALPKSSTGKIAWRELQETHFSQRIQA